MMMTMKEWNQTSPVTKALLDELPLPDHGYFRNLGGGHYLGAARACVQSMCSARGEVRVKRGDEALFGSNDLVAISMKDLEELARNVAEGAVRDYLRDQKTKAAQRRGFETWPGWNGDPGTMNLPNGWEILTVTRNGETYYTPKLRCENEEDHGPNAGRYGHAVSDYDEAVVQCWRLARNRYAALRAKEQKRAAIDKKIEERTPIREVFHILSAMLYAAFSLHPEHSRDRNSLARHRMAQFRTEVWTHFKSGVIPANEDEEIEHLLLTALNYQTIPGQDEEELSNLAQTYARSVLYKIADKIEDNLKEDF